MEFQSQIKILTEGGSFIAGGAAHSVTNADVGTIYISIASSFKKYADIGADPGARTDAYLQNALRKNYC